MHRRRHGAGSNPSTDTPHCDITAAQALKVAHNGDTFNARYKVTTGIIGDGYCGTAGHATCVIGVGTAQGLGTVVRISSRAPPHDAHDVDVRPPTATS